MNNEFILNDCNCKTPLEYAFAEEVMMYDEDNSLTAKEIELIVYNLIHKRDGLWEYINEDISLAIRQCKDNELCEKN